MPTLAQMTTPATKKARVREHVVISYDTAADAAGSGTPANNGILPSHNLPGMKEQDNAAIALRTIMAGEPLVVHGQVVSKAGQYDVPEGHRFAARALAKDEPITSWGIPFGIALRDIAAGEYLCNIKSLATFKDRNSTLAMPAEPNFVNAPFKRHVIDPETFVPAPAPDPSLLRHDETFLGFPRGKDDAGRGVGTRNYILVLGVSALAGGFVRAVEALYSKDRAAWKALVGSGECDGVVCVAHTEGGALAAPAGSVQDPASTDSPNNAKKTYRTLSGFATHPNVGGVLLVDVGTEVLQADALVAFMRENNYALESMPHDTLRLGDRSFSENIELARQKVDNLLRAQDGVVRVSTPVSGITVAQQCGGSDAFSGISANPLTGWMAKRLILSGGTSLLAETDELIGAEAYVTEKIPNLETGRKFLRLIDRFYRYTTRFGHSPEGNPSAGNLFRGLYNITLKSAGAGMKKSPDVRLENVIEYGERLGSRKGYSFMDSPGNDLESIAGQVASGCNVIIFTTGNGSITNFPFVPTLKVLTTSKRFALLEKDMDINAGLYLDGAMNLDELGEDAYQLLLSVAAGERSRGELAGHHQVQLWRNWSSRPGDDKDAREEAVDEALSGPVKASDAETFVGQLKHASGEEEYTRDGVRAGKPAHLVAGLNETDMQIAKALPKLAYVESTRKSKDGKAVYTSENVALVVPTSLCSSRPAHMYAEHINKLMGISTPKPDQSLSRVVALPHTEGCGHSAGEHENLVVRTLVSYSLHPMVSYAVWLEHGCEKTHNDRFLNELAQMGLDTSVFGFASVQLDGGIDKAKEKLTALVGERFNHGMLDQEARQEVPLSNLRVGLLGVGDVPRHVLEVLSLLTSCLTKHGASVVTAGGIKGGAFFQSLLQDAADALNGTLGYGQVARAPGLHVMSCSGRQQVELLTGLAATGVDVVVSFVKSGIAHAVHPLVPVLQVTTGDASRCNCSDMDLVIPDEASLDSPVEYAARIGQLIVDVASRRTLPKLFGTTFVDFQFMRSETSVSM